MKTKKGLDSPAAMREWTAKDLPRTPAARLAFVMELARPTQPECECGKEQEPLQPLISMEEALRLLAVKS